MMSENINNKKPKSDSSYYRAETFSEHKAKDHSQPKSDAILLDGLLAVPLLRHQRIALPWMVKRESSSKCSGGILADDQGLGKTVSIIALILKERPPATETSQDKGEDFDKEKDILFEKQDPDVHLSVSNETSKKRMKSVLQNKGRLAGGTLVVCPTSILRQWADELRNKVTKKGKLSVLIYHGSNRTRDPFELAKYDVVLTTYSVVSMEVPEKPLADGEDENKGKPLAKVEWFRVVLDEAQSIKNHRTQVAKACCGLQAKCRWCLSGTPIQNVIDDLYSYFRFLRYDPYAVYELFCKTIKIPIRKDPTIGYRKLQAVLETIMLRRTKGTLLYGKPIIDLPPKSIELRRVEFTAEERDFYSRLERGFRAQFEEYASAGTLIQNYVNILLMLLRLRQACDNPLLVGQHDSKSSWKTAIEKAKKLSFDKKVFLLNCSEASSAICGICSDAPEDAVVSECGHVFCNQCIGDSLAGDDNQCPNTRCKARLTLKAAGLGLNMVAANHVLLLDPWWNPATEGQAIDRGHRIGQTRPVTVYRFTVKDTIEDRILSLQQNKRKMVASAFGEDQPGGLQTRLTEDDLKYLFNSEVTNKRHRRLRIFIRSIVNGFVGIVSRFLFGPG